MESVGFPSLTWVVGSTLTQVNFWMPHELGGDKYLVFLTPEASAALVQQGEGYMTAVQLPLASAAQVCTTERATILIAYFLLNRPLTTTN